MKTEEFVKRIEELGLKADKFNNDMVIGDTHRYYCCLSNKERYRMGVFHEHLEKLEEEVRHKLLDLVVEYAKTPIEEREEPKKYYLKLPDFVSSDRYCYLNYKERNKHYLFSSDEECEYYQSKFTQEEIDAMPNQEFIKTLMKLEVKE